MRAPALGLVLSVGLMVAFGVWEGLLLLVGSVVVPGTNLDSNGFLWGNNAGFGAFCLGSAVATYAVGGVLWRVTHRRTEPTYDWAAAGVAIGAVAWGTLDLVIAAVYLGQAVVCGNRICA